MDQLLKVDINTVDTRHWNKQNMKHSFHIQNTEYQSQNIIR